MGVRAHGYRRHEGGGERGKGASEMIRIKGKVGDLKTKDGVVFAFRGEVSPSDDELIALRHLQQAPEVVFTIEPAVEQQSLPLDKPAAVVDVPGQVKLFKTCPECGVKMERAVSGRFVCLKCGMVETTAGDERAEASEASEDDQADESEEDEEEPEQTAAGPPAAPDEFAGFMCPECGEREVVHLPGAGVVVCPNADCDYVSEAEARLMLEQESCPEDQAVEDGTARAGAKACGRRRWIDPATGKVYELGQGIGSGWGLFERKPSGSLHRVRGVEYQDDRRAVEAAAAEYAERHGWQEVTDGQADMDPLDGEPIRQSEVDWILRCPASDVNYLAHLPTLTDRELLYCLAKEERTSSRVQLKREIRRRLRQREGGQEPDLHPEWTARLRAALEDNSGPEEVADDARPFRPAAVGE